ncbi:MAG: DHH family phosphoesterase, partial [Lachnospiraceae bacterium]|nr:DHH family phosphoesterase [Lachnospiraceae bacterium]
MVQTKRADFNGLAERLGVSPISVRIMRNRGLETEEEMRKYLYGTLDELYDGSLMKDMGKAVKILTEKFKAGKKIRIIGDYDIDGVCATYLLLTGLRRAAGNVNTEDQSGILIDYEIPDRVKDGYGINESIIRQAAADGVDTIITCDNGISAWKEIALAKEFGMTVIVTDHHEVPVDENGNQNVP